MRYIRPIDQTFIQNLNLKGAPTCREYTDFESGYWEGQLAFDGFHFTEEPKQPQGSNPEEWGFWLGYVDKRDGYTWNGGPHRAWRDWHAKNSGDVPTPYESPMDLKEFALGYLSGLEAKITRDNSFGEWSAFLIGVQKGRIDKYRRADRRNSIAEPYNEVVRWMALHGVQNYGWTSGDLVAQVEETTGSKAWGQVSA